MLPVPDRVPQVPESTRPKPFPTDPLSVFYRETGLDRLNPIWAKLEIILGLLALSTGLFFILRKPAHVLEWMILGIVLFTLGGYLALAGHRSHLYQSNNRLAAYLAGLIRSHTAGPNS